MVTTVNAIMDRAAHLNLTDPTRFAVTGNDGNTQGGFAQIANYLVEHPMLSAVDLRVLLVLIGRSESYDQLAATRAVRSKARLEDLMQATGLTRPTLRKAVDRLERLEIISRHTVDGEARFKIEPGPWPLLGDRPQKGLRWRDFYLFAPARLIVKVWERVIGRGVRGEETIVAFYDELANESQEVRRAREEHESEKNLQSSDEAPVIETVFLTPPRHDRRHRNAEHASRTRNTRKGLARARADYSNNKDSLIEGSSRDETGTLREPGSPGGSPGHTRSVDARPGEAPGNPDGQQGLEGPERVVGARIQGVNTAYDAIAAAVAPIVERQPRRPQNKLSLFKTRYKQRLEDEFDVFSEPFTVAKNAALRQVMKRFGEDHMLAALDWFFDNWTTLKAAEGKFFANDDFPPLRVLFSFDMMGRWEPMVKAGKPATVAPLTFWHGWGIARGEELDEFQQEHGNLLTDIDL